MAAHLATVRINSPARHCGERRYLITDIKFDVAVERASRKIGLQFDDEGRL